MPIVERSTSRVLSVVRELIPGMRWKATVIVRLFQYMSFI